ncbi:MAG TPA: serine protease [Actinophytocola sp.]|uniref:serine protease n=1 Tax=Actinophytocola sp. TaxID=1872138 RepID=UPI002DDD446C|nr:serine protease [Actinophytocola sp.]HEV2782420.1 serine protease [Actinophytocola sp.]
MRRCLTMLVALAAALTTATPAAAGPDVVGGERAAPGEFPWMVRLSMGCGGSLIAPDVVLTAAHCAGRTGQNTSITATIGTIDLADADAVKVRSTHVYRPPEYVNYDQGSDWALIRLDKAVEQPLLPITDTPRHDTGTVTVMGWGADREGGYQQRWLLKARVPIVADDICGTAYRASGVNFADDAMICAGLFEAGGVDTCQGDSGGPMVTTLEDGTHLQVGIVSWGQGCARPKYPGIYTQLSSYAAKITEALAELPPADPGTADSADGKFTHP